MLQIFFIYVIYLVPEHWNTLYPIADGKYQSPIDIVVANASKEVRLSSSLLTLEFVLFCFVCNHDVFEV